MSQRQVAALLACAFFGLFPYRSDGKMKKEYEHFANPNFNTLVFLFICTNFDLVFLCRLYERGHIQKVEKLRCILHYFQRITEKSSSAQLIFFLSKIISLSIQCRMVRLPSDVDYYRNLFGLNGRNPIIV